ncbi:cysteine proteinase [Aulographum hederae CBS 113979]|uniref:Cysteine proteinase n=1 Tax=Aulographum hederae CBS 113979 TaxID=1176131 RepID=A0A6G1H444_9PEZI|nr:cysteine proteinase [Aulographum hederae CBS 113979]
MSLLRKLSNRLTLVWHAQLMAPEDAYLSYHDIRLTKSDVDSIRFDWLTDNAIAFWEEYLERERLPQYPRAKICLLRPSMAFMLANTPDPNTIRDALPDLTATTHIFLPVNDNNNVAQAEGGSHWSLLLVSSLDGCAFHYDSMSDDNVRYASNVANKLGVLLGKQLKFLSMRDSPQQENSSDCGVFVCMNMKHLLLNRLLQADSSARVSMSMGDKVINARKGRKEMLDTIENFRKEGERRRSGEIHRSVSPFRRSLKHGSNSPPRIGDEQSITSPSPSR